jgi:hypothetical protein
MKVIEASYIPEFNAGSGMRELVLSNYTSQLVPRVVTSM